MHIVIAEDDIPVAMLLSSGLESEKHTVRIATGGRQAQELAEESACDLMILDLNLPDINGLEVLRNLRARRPHLPVLILTGSASVESCVEGLDSGADDYLTKPFSYTELSARVRALLRRGERTTEAILQVMDLKLDRVRRTTRRGGRTIELTPKEMALLELLMLHAGRNVSRAMILDQVWNLKAGATTNVVDVYINYLRRKVDRGAATRLIHTARGAGYRIGEPASVRTSSSPQEAS